MKEDRVINLVLSVKEATWLKSLCQNPILLGVDELGYEDEPKEEEEIRAYIFHSLPDILSCKRMRKRRKKDEK